jgi:hypothetical protein
VIDIDPPVLPLTPDRFQRALRTGHGRAKDHVLRHGAAGLEGPLLDACAWCSVYDPQCEESRAGWIVDMVSRAALGGRAVEAIEEASARPDPVATFWHRDHRCSVLQELAERSVPGARDLLYSMLSREPGTADVVGAAQIVELDGEAGLVTVARFLGRWLAQDPDFWVDNEVLDTFDERQGPGAGLAVLGRTRAEDPDVDRFLTELERRAREDRGHLKMPHRLAAGGRQSYAERMKSITAADVIALVRGDPPDRCLWLGGWGRCADADARSAVFAALLEEVESRRIARFLRVFARSGPPRLDERLLRWVDVREDGVGYLAVRVLAHVSDPRVRELAIQRLARAETARGAIPLLLRTFVPGDHQLIESALQDGGNDHELHSLLQDVVEVFEAHPVREAARSLWFAYEHTPCTNCRLRAMELLVSMAALTPWIVEEARLDASSEIRALVRDHDVDSNRRPIRQ